MIAEENHAQWILCHNLNRMKSFFWTYFLLFKIFQESSIFFRKADFCYHSDRIPSPPTTRPFCALPTIFHELSHILSNSCMRTECGEKKLVTHSGSSSCIHLVFLCGLVDVWQGSGFLGPWRIFQLYGVSFKIMSSIWIKGTLWEIFARFLIRQNYFNPMINQSLYFYCRSTCITAGYPKPRPVNPPHSQCAQTGSSFPLRVISKNI